MKYEGVCIAVKDVERSKRFYQELFELEVFQDYGINVSFGGLSLQQEFDWLIEFRRRVWQKGPIIWNCTLRKIILTIFLLN